MTITKALNLLVDQGLILRKKGAGTFIKPNVFIKESDKHLLGTTKRNSNSTVNSYILKFDIVKADLTNAKRLNINVNDFIYDIIRVREIDGRKSIIEYTQMSVDTIPGLKEKHIYSSIYDYIQSELKIVIKSSHINIKSAIPNELELNNLDFSKDKFLIETNQIVYSDCGEIVEFSKARHVHNTFEFTDNYIL